MNVHPYQADFLLEHADNHRLALLCGQLDEHLNLIERRLAVEITNRGARFHVIGAPEAVKAASQVIQTLYQFTAKPKTLTAEQIHLLLSQAESQLAQATKPDSDNVICINTPKAKIKALTVNQQRYLKNMAHYDINFGIGHAGTGKTFLAVARAVEALEQGQVSRLILVRPAVEAGENLGFLPGDLSQKIDPYLRPLYDSLYEMLGFERVNQLIERHVIELAPLAYMRGRTLNDAFIILDESQNTSPAQMKMFLTRIGFNAITVITGDITQIDLPKHQQSGLRHSIDILENIKQLSFTFFQTHDAVRHPLIQTIINAYEQHETKS